MTTKLISKVSVQYICPVSGDIIETKEVPGGTKIEQTEMPCAPCWNEHTLIFPAVWVKEVKPE